MVAKRQAEVEGDAMRVLALIRSAAREGRPAPSNAALQKLLGARSRSTAQNFLDRLVMAGMISITYEKGRRRMRTRIDKPSDRAECLAWTDWGRHRFTLSAGHGYEVKRSRGSKDASTPGSYGKLSGRKR